MEYIGGACQINFIARRLDQLIAAAPQSVRIVRKSQVAVARIALRFLAFTDDCALARCRGAEFFFADQNRPGSS